MENTWKCIRTITSRLKKMASMMRGLARQVLPGYQPPVAMVLLPSVSRLECVRAVDR